MMDEKKQYTLAEVGRNDGSNGRRLWIVLWAKVYDVTDYVDEHPGGADLIAEFAGKDASAGFDDFGHSSDAKKSLKKYQIGVLAGEPGCKLPQRRRLLSAILGPCVSA